MLKNRHLSRAKKINVIVAKFFEEMLQFKSLELRNVDGTIPSGWTLGKYGCIL
jgi:hypothetical protein